MAAKRRSTPQGRPGMPQESPAEQALNASLTPPEYDINKPAGADAPPQQGYLGKTIRAGRGRPAIRGPRMVPQGPAGEPESPASRALPAPGQTTGSTPGRATGGRASGGPSTGGRAKARGAKGSRSNKTSRRASTGARNPASRTRTAKGPSSRAPAGQLRSRGKAR